MTICLPERMEGKTVGKTTARTGIMGIIAAAAQTTGTRTEIITQTETISETGTAIRMAMARIIMEETASME